jgi:hypothetical protein
MSLGSFNIFNNNTMINYYTLKYTYIFRAGACGLLVTNETMGSAVSSVGDLLEFGVGDLVDMFSITQKQIRTITVGSMDSTTDAIFSKLDGILSLANII